MNSVNLIGRITRDPDVKYSGDTTVSRFALALDNGKDKDASFINIVTFNQTAEFTEKYFAKGMRVGISGRITSGSYTNKDGCKVYTTDVIGDRVYFADAPKEKEEPKTDNKQRRGGRR